ncbi:hypothetical protein [Granulicella sp. dw_53]|uniref:hypothetical protein n=1 Tax=Granulicella sp. dw_53 TaxID=2719792 RepID=UPI001BD301ED|nr:hypothetical protein [Granulicella sp. dw_53]
MKSTPPRAASADPEQTPSQIALTLESFLAENPASVLLEDGKVLFDLRSTKYSLATEHGRCTLHLWSEDRNLVRRITSTTLRNGVLRLASQRFGQTKPQTLELSPDKDRRTPSTREAPRTRYLRVLQRVLERNFRDWKPDAFRTAMDLEKSFGPAYARGSLIQGQKAWAVIAINPDESPSTIDGILTLGILWLHHCRESGDGRRLYQGLKLIVPRGMGTLTLSRLAWLNPAAAQWELYELNSTTEELEQREAADHGNLTTRLLRAPNQQAARERFSGAAARVMALIPPAMHEVVEQKIRSASELAFLLHGLEFARIRTGYSGNSFHQAHEISFGAGANETPLTEENTSELRELTARLFARRTATGDKRDPLYRLQPERWLESVLRRNVEPLDPHLDPTHVYTQVPAFAAADRGMLDLLGVTSDGRLAVIELKADDDLHLALQGLDYWIRVRWHHLQTSDSANTSAFGLNEFQRHGYFPQLRLSPEAPRLYLVAPALRIHPATETVLRYLSPHVDWTLLALDERWRKQVKVVWRKRSADLKK